MKPATMGPLTVSELYELLALIEMGARPDSVTIVRNGKAVSPVLPMINALKEMLVRP